MRCGCNCDCKIGVGFPKPSPKILVELRWLMSSLMSRFVLWVVVLVVAKVAAATIAKESILIGDKCLSWW